jgi:hypothetical protein
MPNPRPPQQTDLSGGPAEIDAKMAEAEVTRGLHGAHVQALTKVVGKKGETKEFWRRLAGGRRWCASLISTTACVRGRAGLGWLDVSASA